MFGCAECQQVGGGIVFIRALLETRVSGPKAKRRGGTAGQSSTVFPWPRQQRQAVAGQG
jgi:hypothetical protein